MSNLSEHNSDGIRYKMHLSAPNGGIAQMLCDPEGHWVSWEDYARLKEEVKRLRKAGDAMSSILIGRITSHEVGQAIDRWDAAKGGKHTK